MSEHRANADGWAALQTGLFEVGSHMKPRNQTAFDKVFELGLAEWQPRSEGPVAGEPGRRPTKRGQRLWKAMGDEEHLRETIGDRELSLAELEEAFGLPPWEEEA